MTTARRRIAKNIAIGMTLAFISGALFTACLFGDNADVTAFWKEVVR